MVHQYGFETSHEDRTEQRMQVLYTRKTQERQIFMQDLAALRKQSQKRFIKLIINNIGPSWYQVLSVPQRKALDTLEQSIYQDILKGRPERTAKIIKILGLYPQPSPTDLMNCVYLGRNDPKEMFAQLYFNIYGNPIDDKMASYNLNAKLMLSAIFYLGSPHLISLLSEMFRPDPVPKVEKPKPIPKAKAPPDSPYLQKKIVAPLCVPPTPKRPPPLPLPKNLDVLNEPYEDDLIIVRKPAPPPPPPPPPKKRIPRYLCDKMAGILHIEPYSSKTNLAKRPQAHSSNKKLRALRLPEVKKKYGMNIEKKPVKKKKPVAPSTGLQNAQYVINGVCYVRGKAVFNLGNVSILPPNGDMIHMGFRRFEEGNINIHGGFRGKPPPPKPPPCDCTKKWHDAVIKYAKSAKCYCNHLYDFGNEGEFPTEELAFFDKPTRHVPYSFNYSTIYELDPKSILVAKDFKRIWDNDSVLHEDDPTMKDDRNDKKKKKPAKRSSTACLAENPKPEGYVKCAVKNDSTPHKDGLKSVLNTDSAVHGVGPTVQADKKDKKKKIIAKTSATASLGEKPKPEEYLKSALRLMRKVNIAARLPELHLVPELKEWMRRRIHGPMTPTAKRKLLRYSTMCWQIIEVMARHGYGHVATERDANFAGETTWLHKHDLDEKFRAYTEQYKLKLFRAQAKFNNMYWSTMCQAQLPDKKFREIYFSYLCGGVDDMALIHPHSTKEVAERKMLLQSKAYRCPPAGVEPK